MIDSDRLGAFVAFAQHLSFTRAAQQLHVSQPALHVQIRKLSESLGVPLYVRRGRALALTEDGQRLLALGRELEERTESFLAALAQSVPTRPVVLAAGEGSSRYLLGDAIRGYQKLRLSPLRVLTRNQQGALEAVRSGEAHLAVTVLNEVPADLSAGLLARVGTMVVLPLRHRLAGKRALVIADLAGEPLVLPQAGSPQREALASAFAAAGAALVPAVEASGWDVLLHFARLGLGLAVVNDFCAVPPGMTARPLRGLNPVQYHVVRRRDAQLNASARQLQALLLG